jgi:hypothetical protein
MHLVRPVAVPRKGTDEAAGLPSLRMRIAASQRTYIFILAFPPCEACCSRVKVKVKAVP